jgi:NADH-quinone oxidoreductase subunit B
MTFGLACCAIEMMATIPALDIDRFGRRLRPSLRQSDLIIIAGTVTLKMGRSSSRFDQMPEPKWAIAMGCASTGGPLTYSTMVGVDRTIPWTFIFPVVSAT